MWCWNTYYIITQKEPDKKHYVLVISPIESLMLDQVSQWEQYGVAAGAIIKDADKDALKREYHLWHSFHCVGETMLGYFHFFLQ